jgi:hypothetical protein
MKRTGSNVHGHFLHAFAPALVAAGVAIVLYAVLLGGGFAYDFYGIVRNDPHLLHPGEWGAYWGEAYNGGVDNLYRPLASTLFAVQSYLFGIDDRVAWRFHVISLLEHAAVCALVAEFTRRLVNWRAALIAGLLYAVHPIHVEVLGDIVGQAEMMCALGTLGAMLLLLRRSMTIWRVFGIFICFVFALLSKEQGMLLPALLLCLTSCIRWRAQSPALQGWGNGSAQPPPALKGQASHRERQSWQWLIVLLCFGLGGYIVVRENFLHLKFWWDRSFLDPAINPMVLSAGKDRLLMPLVLLGRYTQLLIFPWKLAPDHSGAAIGSVARLNDPYLYFGIVMIIVWFALCAIAMRRRAGVMLFCLLGLALTYGLVGNIVTLIGTNFAERLMYLPSVFFVILLAIGIGKLPTRVLTPMLAIILVLASIRTFTYARRWNDRLTLYEKGVRDQQGAVRLYMNLATEYLERNQPDQAMQTVQRAQQVMPGYARICAYTAAVAIKTGRFDLARQYLQRSDEIDPRQAMGVWQQLSDAEATTRPATNPSYP